MTGPSIRHLRYFLALAEHRHFGRAAEACAISQPALSQQIREFEALLGASLVERGPRQIRLTALGEAVARRASAIVAAVDELPVLARVAQGALTGPLRLGLIPTVAPYLLPRLIRRFGEQHPALELRPREAMTHRLLADLVQGQLDCAIMALPVSEPGLQEQPLFAEEFWLLRPAAAAEQPVPDLRNLRGMRLLLLEEGHCFRDQAIAYCGMSSLRGHDLLEGSSLATLVQMVGAGMGVTLVPEMALDLELRSGGVAAARLPEPRPMRLIGMVWRRSSPLAEALRGLAPMVAALAANPKL